MIKKLFFLFFVFNCFCQANAQTGPGGDGSSANNVLWLKADAGTSSSTNGTALSFWNDQSGNALYVTQTVTAQQPSFATNILNGFPAIQFDNLNGANLNDKMLGPDSPLLDNTSGYSFFMVTRPQNVDNNARVIVSKRTTVAVDQSFMQFFFTGSTFYTDIQTNNNRYNTTATFASNTNYLIDQFFDGTQALASRCRTYISGSLDITSSETNTLVPDNPSPLVIGSTDASDPRPYGGYIAETIIYRVALNDASRILVDNYLSAKYNISLSANDKYSGDNVGNGDYDREVAGIGQESTGSNTSFSASVSGGLTMAATAGLDNGDYIVAGHALATNATIITDVGGMTGSNNARWQRIWYIDVTNASTNITTDLEFDMSDGGMGTFTIGATSNYVLLYRAGQSGNWTEVTTASSVSGDRILFNTITLTNDGYYTLGTKNFNLSPLPIELIAFSANGNGTRVDLNWTTASEKNNAFFSLERSRDGLQFDVLRTIKGAKNSSMTLDYWETDYKPYPGISYYRLKQTDYDGTSSYSDVVAVNLSSGPGSMRIYPNPNTGSFRIDLDNTKKEILVVLRDLSGKEYFSKVIATQDENGLYLVDTENKIPAGTYLVVASSNNTLYTQKIIVK